MHQKGAVRIASFRGTSRVFTMAFFFATGLGRPARYSSEGSRMKQQAIRPTTRNTRDSVRRVALTVMLLSMEPMMGLNATVPRPKAAVAMPVAKPRLWGNHFCTQDKSAP